MNNKLKLLVLYLFLASGISYLLVRFTGIGWPALRAVNVFILAVYLWVTELVHPTITALLIFCLLPTAKVLSSNETLAVMGDFIIWRLMGILLVAKGMDRSGLAGRIAIQILALARGNLRRLLMLMELLTLIFVFLVPAPGPRTAILATICMGMVGKINQDHTAENFAKAAAMTIPFTSLITSNSIIVGASATIYAVGFLQKTLNYEITYLSWMRTTLPSNLLVMVVIYLVITRLYPFPGPLGQHAEFLEKERTALGPISRKEWKMMAIMGFLLVSWVTPVGDDLPVEIMAATLLIMPGIDVLERKDAFRSLDWETLLLFGAGLAMAEGLNKTGAINFLINDIAQQLQDIHLVGWALAIIAITVIARLGMANMTGVVVTLLPVFTSLALAVSINPIWVDTICIMASGLGIFFPSQSSSLLATYSFGYYGPRDLAKASVLVALGYTLIIILTAIFYWPLIGLHFRP